MFHIIDMITLILRHGTKNRFIKTVSLFALGLVGSGTSLCLLLILKAVGTTPMNEGLSLLWAGRVLVAYIVLYITTPFGFLAFALSIVGVVTFAILVEVCKVWELREIQKDLTELMKEVDVTASEFNT